MIMKYILFFLLFIICPLSVFSQGYKPAEFHTTSPSVLWMRAETLRREREQKVTFGILSDINQTTAQNIVNRQKDSWPMVGIWQTSDGNRFLIERQEGSIGDARFQYRIIMVQRNGGWYQGEIKGFLSEMASPEILSGYYALRAHDRTNFTAYNVIFEIIDVNKMRYRHPEDGDIINVYRVY